MKRVLIAEDDDGLRNMMSTWLRRIPEVEVIATGDGAEALSILRSRPIEFVISDLQMPGANGTDLLRAAGSLEATRPRVYILSGLGDLGPDDLRSLGAHGVFEKTQVSALLKQIRQELTTAA